MKPEDIFYYSEKRSWFTKHALSVERVGLTYQVMRYRNNKLEGNATGLWSLFEVEQQLKICVDHAIFNPDIIRVFNLAITRMFLGDNVRYKIKGACLGRINHPKLSNIDIYHTFNNSYCYRRLEDNFVESILKADIDQYLVELALKDNIKTYIFE